MAKAIGRAVGRSVRVVPTPIWLFMKAARMAVGQTGPVVNIALGAVDKALTETLATGRMTEAQKGALNRETSEKVERVEELSARARKYNLPAAASGPER